MKDKIKVNIAWLIFDKAVRICGGVFVGAWVARYLGVEKFGILSLAMVIISILITLSNLGLKEFVIKDAASNGIDENIFINDAFLLKIIAVSLFFLILNMFLFLSLDKNFTLPVVLSILSFKILFSVADLYKWVFDGAVLSKYSVWVENIIFIIFSSIKFFFLVLEVEKLVFVWLISFESFLILLSFSLLFKKIIMKTKICFKRLGLILRKVFPVMLSSVLIIVYMRLDQLMLGLYDEKSVVGLYSAAMRLNETMNILPAIIISSVFPYIIKKYKSKQGSEKNDLSTLLSGVYLLGGLSSMVLFIFSDSIILFLYGSNFLESAVILKILAVSLIFSFMTFVCNKWFIMNGLERIFLLRTFWGVLLNFFLNLILIPIYSGVGAAIATCISAIFMGFLLNAMNSQTRSLFELQVSSLLRIIFLKIKISEYKKYI